MNKHTYAANKDMGTLVENARALMAEIADLAGEKGRGRPPASRRRHETRQRNRGPLPRQSSPNLANCRRSRA
jgi:hypothetical protein